MLARGRYKARPIQWTLGYTASGKEEVAVELAFSDPNLEVSSMTWYGFWGEKSVEITTKALRTMGWQGIDLATLLEPTALNTDAEVELVIEHEEYQGQISAKIKFINAPGGVAVKHQMSPEEARAFAAKMRGAIAGVDQAAGRKQPALPTPAQRRPALSSVPADEPPTDRWGPVADKKDDEIPF